MFHSCVKPNEVHGKNLIGGAQHHIYHILYFEV